MDVGIDYLTQEQTHLKLQDFLANRTYEPKIIFTPNTEIVMMCQKDEKLRSMINQGDMVLPDGIGLIIGAKLKKHYLPERITGFDTSVYLLNLAKKKNLKVFFLGGKPGVAEEAMEKCNQKYDNIIVGSHHGFFKGAHIALPLDPEEQVVLNQINHLKPDILFVGMGSPYQENWIIANKNQLNTKCIIGNGGTIDVLSGQVKRAPRIFQKLGLEWFYRLVMDPKRIKRQVLLPLFLWKIVFGPKDIVKKTKID